MLSSAWSGHFSRSFLLVPTLSVLCGCQIVTDAPDLERRFARNGQFTRSLSLKLSGLELFSDSEGSLQRPYCCPPFASAPQLFSCLNGTGPKTMHHQLSRALEMNIFTGSPAYDGQLCFPLPSAPIPPSFYLLLYLTT